MSEQKTQKQSILRQLTGAVVGGTLALGLYYGYEYGAPRVTALLTLPQTQNSVAAGVTAQKSLTEEQQRRITSRARNIVNTFGKEAAPEPAVAPSIPDGWDEDALAASEFEPAEDDGWGLDAMEPAPALAAEPEPDVLAATDTAWDDTWDDSYFAEEPAVAEVAEATVPDLSAEQRRSYVAEVAAVSQLPSSGFEVWALLTAALGLASLLKYRRHLVFWH